MAQPQILVLDDDPMVLALMRDLLEGAGYQAGVDRPDVGVLDRLHAAPPALVILDVYAPCQERSWMLLSQLRGDPTTRAIPVLITTTDTHWLAANEAALATRGLRVLMKPFEVTALLEIVATLLGHAASSDRSAPVPWGEVACRSVGVVEATAPAVAPARVGL